MVVDCRRQLGERGRCRTGLGLPDLVIKAHQRVLVGHIQRVADQRQAVGRIELVGKHGLEFVHAVAVGVAQQGQPVAALDRRVALGLDLAGDHVLRLEIGGAAAAPFGHQDVAVGQYQGLARDGQVGGDGGDAVTLGDGGHAITPCGRLGDGHVRHHATVRRGQLGGVAGLVQRRSLLAARGQRGSQHGDGKDPNSPAAHRTPPTRRLANPIQVASRASTETITDHTSAPGMIAHASRA
ncbi:hypothetical protein D3C72_1302180 [compost metagenome]